MKAETELIEGERYTKFRQQLLTEFGLELALSRLAIADLSVDPGYQRAIEFSKLCAKSATLEPSDFVILVAMRPSGECFVVDGQHRAAIAAARGISTILAYVFLSEDRDQEDAIFRFFNERQKPEDDCESSTGSARPVHLMSRESMLAQWSQDAGGVDQPEMYLQTAGNFDRAEILSEKKSRRSGAFFYARIGNPTVQYLEGMLADLDGSVATRVVPSGLAASIVAIQATVGKGGVGWVSQCCYGALKKALRGLDVNVKYFDPSELDTMLMELPNVGDFVYLENPGCKFQEFSDLERIIERCRETKKPLIVDNTWGTALYCSPLSIGADISIQSASKHLTGHNNVMMGVISANENYADEIRRYISATGYVCDAHQAYLAANGLRTLGVRLERQSRNARAAASLLTESPSVVKVFHPEFNTENGQEYFYRDFEDAAGLFSVAFEPAEEPVISAAIDAAGVFKHSVGWGGYRSVVELIPRDQISAIAPNAGFGLRISAGLESTNDFLQSVRAFVERLNVGRRNGK